ncbi:MAG: thiamine biosynthesis protein ApbE [Phenylobacterium sp. SCN 69-14]|nr:MAG: thiamine biosynthesis protein ApbE [Phenylobacterium sp. SCN 69-14]
MRIAVPLDLSPEAARPPGGVLASFGGPTMGVAWSVTATTPQGFDIAGVQAQVQGLLNRIVGQMSTWEPDSDISRFNALPAGGWIDMPAAFAHVLARSLHWAKLSGGAFDPTAGRLVDLWGFGPAGAVGTPPSRPRLDEALSACGWDRLAVDGARAYQPGGLSLDFSGIAKGFAVDEVSRALTVLGLPHHLVEIGGELRGQGTKPDGQPWWADIEAPPEAPLPGGPIRVALHGLSIATSGDYRRSFTHAGRRYAHTLDPRTGEPVRHGLRAVTVLDRTCIDADALCTVLGVLGPTDGPVFAQAHGLAAYFLLEDGEILSPRLAAMMD